MSDNPYSRYIARVFGREDKPAAPGLLQFLATARDPRELQIALDVLLEFKKAESPREWVLTPFDCWAKLEQFEAYLRLLTGQGAADVEDDIAKEFLAAHKSAS